MREYYKNMNLVSNKCKYKVNARHNRGNHGFIVVEIFDRRPTSPYYCDPMLTGTLPDRIKPFKLARQGLLLKGAFPLADMKRLASEAITSDGDVLVDIGFLKDDQGYSVVEGSAKVQLQLQCQRCLEPQIADLEVDISLAFVNQAEKMDHVPSQYEASLVEDEEISLIELLEEELLLVLPIVPYHEDCDMFQYKTEAELEAEVAKGKPENPFDMLEELKGKLKPSD